MTGKSELYDVILRPVVTEKSTFAGQANVVVFEVHPDANKLLIREAVETLFNVRVKAVNVTVTKGKVKRFRGRSGKRGDAKKAYVTLEKGNFIDVTTGL